METIYLITSNPKKIEAINNTLAEINLDLKIEMMNAAYPEYKEEGTTKSVVLSGAKWCAEKYKKPVMVTDAGLFIKELNGFPGVNTKFSLDRIGNQGILKLMEGKTDREADWILSIGYCEPEGGEAIEFTALRKGKIAESIRGDKGFGFDPIFILDGYSETFGENPTIRDSHGPFGEVIVKFADWYKTQKRPD